MRSALFGFGCGVALMNGTVDLFGIHSWVILVVMLVGMFAMIHAVFFMRGPFLD